jgi:hypothetical protein
VHGRDNVSFGIDYLLLLEGVPNKLGIFAGLFITFADFGLVSRLLLIKFVKVPGINLARNLRKY